MTLFFKSVFWAIIGFVISMVIPNSSGIGVILAIIGFFLPYSIELEKTSRMVEEIHSKIFENEAGIKEANK